MKKTVFSGLCTALVTPFTEGKPDLEAMAGNIAAQGAAGAAAVLPCGTTGENSTLSHEERRAVISAAVQAAEGKMAVIAGVGGNNTAAVCEAAAEAGYLGVNAVLATAPYYNKATQRGLAEHFTAIADASPAPVILYNVPSRTGVNIEPETYAILSRHENIVGVKEANPDISAFMRSRAMCGDELVFYSGNDDTAVAMMACGAKGVVSVLSNLLPRAVAAICALCDEGQYSEAARRYLRYAPLAKLLFEAPNPIPVKTAMKLMGLDSGRLRLPLCPPEKELEKRLQEELMRLDLM